MKTERPETLNELKDFPFSVKQNKTKNCGLYAHMHQRPRPFFIYETEF